MDGSEPVVRLEALLRRAGRAHKEAFKETDGADPEWPAWYAAYIHQELCELLARSLGMSEIIGLLMQADTDHQTNAPDTDWPEFYARAIIRRLP